MGLWKGTLFIKENTVLPFKMEVSKNDSEYTFSIYNAEEKITLLNRGFVNDSLLLEFPLFNSKLVLGVSDKTCLKGYWQNLNKGSGYKIGCSLSFGYHKRFYSNKLYESNVKPTDVNGKWETTFSPGTGDEYKAVGLFKQHGNDLSGTFLTETGDYRFLEGNVSNDSIYLSCFDGSHAFLFTGKLTDGKIHGVFFSAKHWETNWIGIKNEGFELTHPDSITYLKKNEPFSFECKDLEGNLFHWPSEQLKNKVVIVQLMGTWCPNCMDETVFLNELYTKYHAEGLEIVSVGFEIGKTFPEQVASIQKMKARKKLNFIFLVGGEASKKVASEKFKQLSGISSFPTTLFIGKSGVIEKIHTGFNGPGTGDLYLNFKQETERFVKNLLEH